MTRLPATWPTRRRRACVPFVTPNELPFTIRRQAPFRTAGDAPLIVVEHTCGPMLAVGRRHRDRGDSGDEQRGRRQQQSSTSWLGGPPCRGSSPNSKLWPWASTRSPTTRSARAGPISSARPSGLAAGRDHARRRPGRDDRRRGAAGDARDAAPPVGRRARRGPHAARGQPRARRRARVACRARRSSRSTPRSGRTARPRRSSRPGPSGSRASCDAPLTAAFVREALAAYAERGLLGPVTARRSERFVSREARELRRELLISPYPELGLVAMDGPNDPEPGLVVEDGRVVAMDGRGRRGLRRHRPVHRPLRARPRRRRRGGRRCPTRRSRAGSSTSTSRAPSSCGSRAG